ncbi:MAG TPA: 3-dehydroquinate synthase [Polyangiaceae bacterium]|nr:3-dehydroquinate synthase [Polyangiaceae bacterium]
MPSETKRWRQSLRVPFEYDVYFTDKVFAVDNDVFVSALAQREPERRQRFVVLIDDGVAEAWPDLANDIRSYAEHHHERIELVGEPLVVAGGEAAKNDPSHVDRIWRLLDRHGIDRHSYVVGIGGGAMLDWVGYAAATAHRGVRHVRLPTTVLGQADSGVGVKNGVNAFGKKNFVGTFAPPCAVLNDRDFLTTLGSRDTVAGMAEAVKVSLIRDARFYAWLSDNREALAACRADDVTMLVRRCAELHLEHIRDGNDPFEMGSARPLDFGHWSAHKLESMSDYGLRHGEAVAVGMAIDILYSSLSGLCPRAIADHVIELLQALGFSLWHPALDERGAESKLTVLGGLVEFREHLGGELTITLIEDVGRALEVHAMDETLVEKAIAELRRLAP